LSLFLAAARGDHDQPSIAAPWWTRSCTRRAPAASGGSCRLSSAGGTPSGRCSAAGATGVC